MSTLVLNHGYGFGALNNRRPVNNIVDVDKSNCYLKTLCYMQTRLSIYGRIFVITLIARRSRHFAGTRWVFRTGNSATVILCMTCYALIAETVKDSGSR